MLASGWKLLQGCMATADNEVTYTYIMTPLMVEYHDITTSCCSASDQLQLIQIVKFPHSEEVDNIECGCT